MPKYQYELPQYAVEEIVKRYQQPGTTLEQLAKTFSCSTTTMWRIITTFNKGFTPAVRSDAYNRVTGAAYKLTNGKVVTPQPSTEALEQAAHGATINLETLNELHTKLIEDMKAVERIRTLLRGLKDD